MSASWEAALASLAPAFTAPSFRIFARLLCAWVLCPGRKTITRLFGIAEPCGERAHDAYHRFLRAGAWRMPSLWRLASLLLVAAFRPEGRVALDLDDTLFHKSGRRVEDAAWWRDALRSTGQNVVHAFGLNLLVLSLRVHPPWGGEPLALPLNMRLHRKGGKPLFDLAREVIGEVLSWFPNREFDLCADGFYAPLAGSLPRGVFFTSRLRRDAALFNLPPRREKGQRGRPRKKGERLPTPLEMATAQVGWRRVETEERGKARKRLALTRVALWYWVCGETPILVVISRDAEGRERDDFLFTTDLSASPGEVIARYAGRWAIEDTFRNVKQYLGGQDPQTWRGKGPQRATALSFLLYSLVWHWYIRTQGTRRSWRPLPWYQKKATPSFLDALASLRGVLWRQRLFPHSASPSLLPEIADTLIDFLSRVA